MILNVLGSVAVLLASISTEPRDTNDAVVRVISVALILGAIWF